MPGSRIRCHGLACLNNVRIRSPRSRHSRGDNPPSASTASPAVLTLTGERTIPDLDIENYWFRRHQVVYQRLAPRCTARDVLEAGCGEDMAPT